MKLKTRAAAVAGSRKNRTPATLDEKTRSVDVLIATENPTSVMGEREMLSMDGARLPADDYLPLLNSHDRMDTRNVYGSVDNIRIQNGKLYGRANFSTVKEADDAFIKVKEGHLIDVSVGYTVQKYLMVEQGKTIKKNGRAFKGPLLVATDWTPKEVSLTAVAADNKTRVRSDSKKGVKKMDEKIRAWLEKHGLDPEASDDDALEFMQTLKVRSDGDDGDHTQVTEPKKNKTDGAAEPDPAERAIMKVRAEQTRCSEITSMCQKFELAERAAEFIQKGYSVAKVQGIILDQMAERETPTLRIQQGQDAADKFRAAASDSILLRANVEIVTPEKIAPGAEDLRGLSLRELAREALRVAGMRVGGFPLEMIGRALTTTDFPAILADSARKSLFSGFEMAEETWPMWCGTGEVSDFKTHTLPRLSETSDLDLIAEHQEYTYSDRKDIAESYAVATYGKLFAITRQVIINDDLSALTLTPAAHGEAAARKIGDVVYAVLNDNAAMADGVALFHATHSNLQTSGAPPDTDQIAAGILAMKSQTDLLGKRRLQLRPRFFIAPLALEGSSEVYFRSNWFATEASAGTPDEAYATTRANPYAGDYFSRVYDGRLDDTSATAWYLAATKGKTVNVYFLNGVQRPYLEQKTGWSVDGIEYKVRIDAGAKAVAWEGLYKDPGA